MAMTLDELMATGPAKGSPPSSTAPRGQTLDEILGVPEKAEPPTVLGFLKDTANWREMGEKLLGATLAAGDFVAGAPGQLLAIGAGLGARTAALVKGESRKVQDLSSAEGQALIPEWATAPLQSVAKSFGMQELDQSIVSSAMDKIGELTEKITRGALTQQAAKDILNAYMVGSITHGVDSAVKSYAESKAGTAPVQVPGTPGKFTQFLNQDVGKAESEPSAARKSYTEEEVRAGTAPAEPLLPAEQPYRQPPMPEPESVEQIQAKAKAARANAKAAVKAETPEEKAARTSDAPPEGSATWRSGSTDYPVEITGDRVTGPDSVSYTPVRYNGIDSFVPTKELAPLKVDMELDSPGETPLDLNVDDPTAPPSPGELARSERLHKERWELEKARRAMEEDKAQQGLEAPPTPEELLDEKLNPRGSAKGRRFDRWENALAVGGVAAGAGYMLGQDPEDRGEAGMLLGGGAAIIVGKGKFKGVEEALIIDAARKGDQAAFEHLYADNSRYLDRVLNSYFRGKESMATLEDVKQESFKKAFEALERPKDAVGGFKGESTFRTFLHSIATRKALNAQRTEAYRPTEELTPEMEERNLQLASAMTPEKIALHTAMAEKMEEAIQRLPQNFREPFWMAEVEGLSYAEGAKKLGVPPTTFATQVYRAKQQLQKMLRDYKLDVKDIGGMAAVSGAAALAAYLAPDEQERRVMALGILVPASFAHPKTKAFLGFEKAGMNRDSLWHSTQRMRAGDGTVVEEIAPPRVTELKLPRDPKDSKIILPIKGSHRLGDILDYPQLYKAYPDMAGMTVEAQPSGRVTGSYLPMNRIRLADGDSAAVREVAEHELQHAVETRAKMQDGGSVQQFLAPDYNARASVSVSFRNSVSRILAAAGEDPAVVFSGLKARQIGQIPTAREASTLQRVMARYPRYFADAETAVRVTIGLQDEYRAAFDQYRELGGEALARLAETRMRMSPAERAQNPPWKDLDKPEASLNWEGKSGKSFSESAEEPAQRRLPGAGPGDRQGGAITPRQLFNLSLLAGGAVAGVALDPDHPFGGALMGAGVGLLLSSVKPRDWAEAIKRAQLTGPIQRITDLVKDTAYQKKLAARVAMQMATRIVTTVPDMERRIAIYKYLENEEPVSLSPSELKIAQDVKKYYSILGETAKKAGVVKELLKDYATRIYGSKAEVAFSGKNVGGDTILSSPFGKPRGFRTRAEAEAAGWKPVTLDIARVVEIYSDSITRAIANKNFVQTLKNPLEGQVPLVVKADKAPAGYVFIDHPQLKGYLVHPDVAADVRFVFESRNTGAIIGALDAINTMQKRMGVSLSLFHASALEHALMGAMAITKSPIVAVKSFGQSFMPAIFGESLAIKMIREGGAGDLVDRAMKSGVEFSLERQSRAAAMEEDLTGIYRGMDAATKFLNEAVPKLGTATIGAYTALNKVFDRAMWGRFHATLKLQTFMDKTSELSRNNARAVAAGKAELFPQAKIDAMAASFVNDLYGGLNYYNIVSEFTNRWARELASAALGPTGRLGMRLLMFAPDWTISTTRAFLKAFGPRGTAALSTGVLASQLNTSDPDLQKLGLVTGAAAGYFGARALGVKGVGSGLRGAIPSELGGRALDLADLHRQYLFRSALIYTVLIDSLNYGYTGHHYWENKDPTRLDLGDGRTAMVSKHFMEPFHWLIDPKKQAMSKASFIVKESMSQLGDTEYWSPKGAPRMGHTDKGQDISLPTRLGHAGRQFLPISAQGFAQANPQSALASIAGVGIYGKTTEQREADKATAKARAAERRQEKKVKGVQP